jgi:hybrid cluster-associated redox disulfide protein
MDAKVIDIRLTMDKVMQKWPQSFSVFMKHKTKCVGCFMQQFCTLKDVAATYGLSLETLIEDVLSASDDEETKVGSYE